MLHPGFQLLWLLLRFIASCAAYPARGKSAATHTGSCEAETAQQYDLSQRFAVTMSINRDARRTFDSGVVVGYIERDGSNQAHSAHLNPLVRCCGEKPS